MIIKHEYGARVKHNENEHRFMVSYDMIKTDFSKKGSLALRGTIFGLDSDFKFRGKILCLPFYKFFNYGERHAFKGNDRNIKNIYSKEDGSLIKLYRYKNECCVASNNTVDAYGCSMNNGSTSLGHIFETALRKYDNFSFSNLNTDYIYCFELVSPENRIVVDYDDHKLFHIMTRCIKSLRETNHYIDIPRPMLMADMFTISEAISHLQNSFGTEGLVVEYDCGNRVKIKTDWYIMHHKTGMKANQCTPKFVVEQIMSGTIDDIVSKYPAINDQVTTMKNKMANFDLTVSDFLYENNISYPVDPEFKKEMFKSGKMSGLDPLVKSAVSGILCNKIKDPVDILKNKKFVDQFIKEY